MTVVAEAAVAAMVDPAQQGPPLEDRLAPGVLGPGDAFIGPGGDLDATREHARELNADLAELALANRPAKTIVNESSATVVDSEASAQELAARCREAAQLLGALGITDSRITPYRVAERALGLGERVDTRVALHGLMAQVTGTLVQGLFRRSSTGTK